MLDPQKLLEQFLGQGGAGRPGQAQQGHARQPGMLDAIPDGWKGFGGGMAAGGLAGLLLGGKKGRKMAKKAAKVGGIAILGGLAYKAYRDWQASSQGGPAPKPAAANDMRDITPEAEGTAFLPAPARERNTLSLKVLQAMIAAAKADGHIDAQEQSRIFAKLDEAGLDNDDKAFLMDELRKPLDVDAVVALADGPEQAVEIYAASCLAIDPDDAAEQAYLAMLAARLKLAPELKANVEREIAALAA